MEQRPTAASVVALRQLLRSYQALAIQAEVDVSTATVVIDLDRALGADSSVSVLTPRQAEVVQKHLIEGHSALEVAQELYIDERVVYLTERIALERLVTFLQKGNTDTRHWQPWQIAYVRRNSHLPREVLAKHVGKSPNAISSYLCRLRRNGELLGTASPGRPHTRRGPQIAEHVGRTHGRIPNAYAKANA